MSEEGGRHDPVHYYGPLTWIVGFVIAGGTVWFMFAFAKGFA